MDYKIAASQYEELARKMHDVVIHALAEYLGLSLAKAQQWLGIRDDIVEYVNHINKGDN